jgi:hypothetical protein
MRTQKVSLSLDAELVEEARRRSGGSNLSAYVSQGLKRQVLADRQGELLDGWEQEFGPIPDDEIEKMARLWPD